MKEAKFDITVEGKTAKDVPFANSEVHRIQTIGFYPNRANCTMYVDYVKVRVIP